MIETQNPIFEKNYRSYLRQLCDADLTRCEKILDITIDENKNYVEIPFFNSTYRVSPSGIVDERGQRPDYGICVVLLKHLLMCPRKVPEEADWITYRDFKDAGQTQNTGLSSYALQAISNRYAGKLTLLQEAIHALGGRQPEIKYPYDIAAVIQALPRLPILFLFNDAEEQFPAKTTILYERRAASFLDAECRIMVDWYLLEELKRAERKKR